MSNNILFVFEGEKTEEQIVFNLQKHFVSQSPIIRCVYGAEIYQIYKDIVSDEDLDTFNLIKERYQIKNESLKDYTRDNFAEIYLFFDYDAHSTLADDDKLKKLLDFFNEETNKGKLYISYPMVEALRHISDYNTFKDVEVKCKGGNCRYKKDCENQEDCINEPHYKEIASKESSPQFCNINRYTNTTWKEVIKAHLSKMSYIVTGKYEYPSKIETQLNIFSKQLEIHINKKCPKVSVLSAFPVFIHDYYGNKETKVLIGIDSTTPYLPIQ